MHLHTWEIVLLVAWVAFSPIVGIAVGQFIRWGMTNGEYDLRTDQQPAASCGGDNDAAGSAVRLT